MSTPEHKSVLQSGSGPSWSGSGPLPEGPATDAVTFGRFQVLGEAGRGAMGVVYAAYDPHLDRRVALKVLRGEANRGEARERTRREAIALAQVSHPNVVHVYEVGEAKRRLFIAMEYVDGPTLKAWLREGQAAPAVVEVLLAMAKGLGAAHARGLVHRDLKPSNVLIGADGRPRIIDFGLARAEQSAVPSGYVGALSSDLTRTGRLLGTPAYMAPELMDGAEPSPLSDQFSFCVTAYEALFRLRPFPNDSMPVMRHAIQRGLLRAPEAIDDCPNHARLLEVLRRGLAADPTERWPSMAALGQALADATRRAVPNSSPPWLVALIGLATAVALGSFNFMVQAGVEWLVLRNLTAVGLLGLGAFLARRQLRAHPAWPTAGPTLFCNMAFLLVSALLAWRFGVSPEVALAFDLVWIAAGYTAGYFMVNPPSAMPVFVCWVGVLVLAIRPEWAAWINLGAPLATVAVIVATELPGRVAGEPQT